MPDFIIVKAGTLDGFAQFTPALEAYCDGRLPWIPALVGAQQFSRSNIGDDG
ncbi:hypothetical protein FHS49_001896 [Sphingobium boeckii]|uniref:Uncharacterized protein n=2 Tax=Sphingobium boeckii TaxID=1082345 RepID=A0A7W9EFB6_9SPHN|nr:hypothetical protein [Sphingobium boeckii]